MVLPFAFFVGVIDNAVPPVNMNYSCGGCIVKGAHLRLLGSDWPTGREARRQWGGPGGEVTGTPVASGVQTNQPSGIKAQRRGEAAGLLGGCALLADF